MQSRFDLPMGNVPWQGGAWAGGWRRNGQKAEGVNQGDLSAQEPKGRSPGRHPRTIATKRAGVRAPVVARKGGKGPGAKGAQEGGDVTDQAKETQPATVSERTQQAGEAQNLWAIRARWAWVEAEVGTERMWTAREEGVKGGKWFRLIDKVYALPNLRKAFAWVKAKSNAAGVDHVTVEEFERHLEANLEKLAQSLREGTYRPQAIRRAWIPKLGSKEMRPLGIPTVRDRVVQAALRAGAGADLRAGLRGPKLRIPTETELQGCAASRRHLDEARLPLGGGRGLEKLLRHHPTLRPHGPSEGEGGRR